jgi:hypothetical protein
MNNLLSANFSRLFKSRVLWLGMAATFVFCAVTMLRCPNGYPLDEYYFNTVPLIGICMAVVTSLFLGTEYSDGAIRNKVIVGHNRRDIYMANLFACMVIALLMTLSWALGGLVGMPRLGLWEMGLDGAMVYLFVSISMAMALGAVFTLVGMLVSNKAATVVITFLLFFLLFTVASMLYNRLSEPEFSAYYYFSQGVAIEGAQIQVVDDTPNPLYLGGAMRMVYVYALSILPTGQMALIANQEITQPLLSIGTSLVVTALAALGGIRLFAKKDLK